MLLLRQDAQKVLDSFRLTDLHVTLTNKTLTLAGICGKPLVIIQGISFSRNTVNEKERIFAIELLEKFLTIHASIIEKFIIDKKTFLALPELILPTNWKYDENSYRTCNVIYYFKDEPTPFSITELSMPKITTNGKISAYSIQELKTINTELEKSLTHVNDWVKEYIVRREYNKELDKRLTTIQTCDI